MALATSCGCGNNVGVGSKPTLFCNHARKSIHRGRHLLCSVFEQNKNQFYSLILTLSPRAREFCRGRRPRRPVVEKNIVGVGSKPTLLCYHARKSIHRGRHLLCPVFEQNKDQFYSLTLTLSQRARGNRLDGAASLRSAPNILQGTASRSESSLTLTLSPRARENQLNRTASLRSSPRSRGADFPRRNSLPTTNASGRIFALWKVFVFIFTISFYHKSTLILQNHMENKSYGQLFIRFFQKIYYYLFSLWKNFIYSIILFVTDQAKRVRQIWYTDK